MYKILAAYSDLKYSPEVISNPKEIEDKYLSYLSDESKTKANSIKSLCRPKNTKELSWILKRNFELNLPSRISGARTGLTAASVPEENECLISLDKFKSISELSENKEVCSIIVEAGVTLLELNNHLKSISAAVFFPVDPTETSASFGGMCSTNASGARSYYYGSVRDWVLGLELVLSNGLVLSIERGEGKINAETFNALFGKTNIIEINDIIKPETKNTIGYQFKKDADLIDLLIGSEGTLAVITKVKLKLEKVPGSRLSYLQCFSSDDLALSFIEKIKEENKLITLAIEFMDRNSINFAMLSPTARNTAPAKLINESVRAAVYIEIILADENQLELVYNRIEEVLSALAVSSEFSFAGIEERDLNELKIFRHAIPEQINALIGKRKIQYPQLHKIATDMAVPKKFLREIYYFYKTELDKYGYEYAIFGHAGNSHFHVNLLPRDSEEQERIKLLYLEFAKKVVGLYGAVAAEHGIGKLKKDFLKIQYNSEAIESMKKIKSIFDPRGLLNKGVIF